MSPTQQKIANREKLLQQGVNLLMEQGYHGTGLKEILDSVQIPKGSFYNYFGSKENFGAEVIQYYIDPFIEQLSGHVNNPNLDGLSALRRYYQELIGEVENQDYQGGCLLGNLMGEIGDTSEVCRNSLQSAVKRYRDLMEQALSKAQREGQVRTDKSAEEMANLLVNLWQGALLRAKIEKSSTALNECYENLLNDLFLVRG